MSSSVVIVGAGGFGREVHNWITQSQSASVTGDLKIIGFLDDGEPDLHLLDQIGSPLLGPVSELSKFKTKFFVAIGDPGVRRDLVARCEGLGAESTQPIIHPSAVIGSSVEIGLGSIVCPLSVITTNIQIGSHVHINLLVTIGHDAIVGDFVTISPGVNVSGNVKLGEGVFIGSGASIRPGVSVGAYATIGAGAAVVKDVPAGETVVGVPAKSIQKHG